MQITQCIMYIWFPPGPSGGQEWLPNKILNKVFYKFFCKVVSCLNPYSRFVEISPTQSYEQNQYFHNNYAMKFKSEAFALPLYRKKKIYSLS